MKPKASKFRTIKIEFIEPQDIYSAWMSLGGSIIFLVKKKAWINVPALYLILNLISAISIPQLYSYLTTGHKIEVEDVQPKSRSHTTNFSVMPQAVAQDKRATVPIVFEGVDFGYDKDVSVDVVKIADEAAVLVHDNMSHKTKRMKVPDLPDIISSMRQTKK
jgi:hypothetical protein